MREASGLFLILIGAAFLWVAIHGYDGAGLPGMFDTIFGGIERS
jgi:hypothetical protein